MPMKIEIDDLSSPAIHALLNEHLRNMYELSPPESVHALDLEKLRRPEITFWSAGRLAAARLRRPNWTAVTAK
jgi:putative acetyltransferase